MHDALAQVILRTMLLVMSVRIEAENLIDAVARRPFGYVVTSSHNSEPHVRAVVFTAISGRLTARVGKQTATNVERNGSVTLLWPPMEESNRLDEYDDYSVIADCVATCADAGDSFTLSATPLAAVWHRPAR